MQSTKKEAQSIPGQWSKDTPKDTPAEELNNPVDVESIPRSGVGIVNETGDIVDDAGQIVGKVPESKNPKELVGNTVTAAGDIVSSTGDVLGKAVPTEEEHEEYTTSSEQKKSSGFGLGSGLKGVYNTVGGSIKGLSGLSIASKTPPTNESQGNTTEKQFQQNEEGGNDEQQSQIHLDDHDPSVKDGLSEIPPEGFEDENFEGQTDITKSEIPQSEIPQSEIPQSEIPPSEIPPSEAPPSEAPPSEIPESEIPKSEAPKSEALESEVPKSDIPKSEGLKSEIPESQAPKSEIPQSEIPQSEIPQSEAPPSEAPETEVPKSEILGSEVPKSEVPESEIPQDEVPKSEILGSDVPQSEVPPSQAPVDEDEAQLTEDKNEETEEGVAIDYSILKGARVNKAGNLVNDKGDVLGRVVEGEIKKILGKRADENGDIWDDAGKKVGKGEPLPDSEREGMKEFAPFENFPDAIVEADGRVTSEGKQVGVVVEGDPKRLKGSKVDEDGDILDRRGNVVGKAEAWDEPEVEPEAEVDNSILAGKRVNKAGNVVDSSGVIYGRVVEGHIGSVVGRMCDKDGNIRSESGDIIGRAELVTEGEREGTKDGPFAELVGCTVTKDGKVVTASGDIVGRLTSGDSKVLFGRAVDEDGDILDRNGNVIGKAERWEEPEVEQKKDPLAGRRVNREGNVVDEDGNLIGKLTSGDLLICSGKEVDADGDVVNQKGQTIGHVTRLEDIPPKEPTPEPEPEESPEEKQKREQAENDKKLAGQLGYVIEQAMEKIRPICKLITDKVDRAERTPKEELDEEQLVKDVKPLIEEGGKILSETNGTIRGLDPDGRIQRNAKHKAATREASPEEFHLADLLKELTGTVTQCIENAKRKIEDMPHAKEELNPLWGLLAEPLFQILAAVGLLLNGVLGLVGRLLSGLGLGGLVDSLLGGLGVDRILDSLGLGSVIGSLTGKNQKKKK